LRNHRAKTALIKQQAKWPKSVTNFRITSPRSEPRKTGFSEAAETR
jgi:hypothetical protein